MDWHELLTMDADAAAQPPAPSEHGNLIDYRMEAFHDVKVYEDGHEERFYIGD